MIYFLLGILASQASPPTVEADIGNLNLTLAISAVLEISQHRARYWDTGITIVRTEYTRFVI